MNGMENGTKRNVINANGKCRRTRINFNGAELNFHTSLCKNTSIGERVNERFGCHRLVTKLWPISSRPMISHKWGRQLNEKLIHRMRCRGRKLLSEKMKLYIIKREERKIQISTSNFLCSILLRCCRRDLWNYNDANRQSKNKNKKMKGKVKMNDGRVHAYVCVRRNIRALD